MFGLEDDAHTALSKAVLKHVPAAYCCRTGDRYDKRAAIKGTDLDLVVVAVLTLRAFLHRAAADTRISTQIV